jgi:hypothetical protein
VEVMCLNGVICSSDKFLSKASVAKEHWIISHKLPLHHEVYYVKEVLWRILLNY